MCWKCGKQFNKDKTTHHTLPKHLNPAKNITVPIHEECHQIINSQDIAGMKANVIRLRLQIEELYKQVGRLNKSIEAFDDVKIADIIGGKKNV